MITLHDRHSSRRLQIESTAYFIQSHASVLAALEHAERRKAWRSDICSSLRTDSPGFHGTPNWETAVKLARHGWPEGRAMLRKARASMPKAALRERVIQWDVAGAYPDVARAVAGAPDCMVDDAPTIERPTQSIRIVVSIATPWTTDLNEFANRGAAILSAVEAAEAAGHRVEVIVEETSQVSGSGFSATILLKAAGQPADRDSLAFFLIHPSSLRRIFFSLLETELELVHFCHNYGLPTPQPIQLRPPGSIYLPNFQTGEFATPMAAFSLVQKLFVRAGCVVEFEAPSLAGG